MFRLAIGSVLAAWALTTAGARAEDASEVKRLKEKIELLEAKLKVAEAEIERLKSAKPEKPPAGKTSLSDRLKRDVVLTGDWKYEKGGTYGTVTLQITHRDGDKVKAIWVSKIKGKSLGDEPMEGDINGTLLTLKRVGSAIQLNMSASLEGDVLKGTISHSDAGKGKVSLTLPK